jgi:phage protein D/phage baseplate assembly protein gpV
VPENYATRPRLQVDGSDLDEAVQPLLEEVVIEHDIRLADMFALRFRDPGHDVLGNARFRIGGEVKIAAAAVGSEEQIELIVGDVTALEAEYDATGSHAIVRGYDRSHRVARGRRTETYRNVTDSDIARTVARRANLEVGQIDETRVTHQHVSQVNLSDWEFLRARAREAGFEAAVTGGKLHFRRPAEARQAPQAGEYDSTDPLQLVFGSNLVTFRPRVSSAAQVSEVEVRGWSPAQKDVVVARSAAATSAASIRDTPRSLAAIFGDPVQTRVDRAFGEQGEVEAAAGALADHVGSAFAAAEGVALGNPRLRAGVAISVAMTGADFDGRYVVNSTSHRFDRRGYRTRFTIGSRQERSLLGLVSPTSTAGPASGSGPPMNGVVTALVTGIDDPDQLGRVKLKFPWLSDTYESDWVRVVQFGAGNGRGAVFLPEVDDEVLVAFEHGEARRPYVIGGLYNGVDQPTLRDRIVDGDGAVERRGFVSRKGHRLVFVDANTDAKVEIDACGDIVIEADGKLELRARSGITLDAGQGNVDVSGTTIRLN